SGSGARAGPHAPPPEPRCPSAGESYAARKRASRTRRSLLRRLDQQLLLAAHRAPQVDEQIPLAVLGHRARRDAELRLRELRHPLGDLRWGEGLQREHLLVVTLAELGALEPR